MPKSTKTSSKGTAAKTTSSAAKAIPGHLSTLTKSKDKLTIATGKRIQVWDLKVAASDPLLGEWARHFRQHYCLDNEIDELREGTDLSRKDYLNQLLFPDPTVAPGPSIRAGDFAELLIADYVEFSLDFWVPRGKYSEKAARNESVKGVDILGFKLVGTKPHDPNDELLAYEVKAQCSGTTYGGCLQKAIDDSSKDFLRRGESLNATKRRLLRSKERKQALVVQRFQNATDRPYIYRSGAAAVLNADCYDKGLLQTDTDEANHNNQGNLEIIVIRGRDLMTLVHALYERAANEA